MTALNFIGGRAENWATQRVLRLLNHSRAPSLNSFSAFIEKLYRTFGERLKKEQSQEAIKEIRQRKDESVLSFQLRFEELASWSELNEEALVMFAKAGIRFRIKVLLYNAGKPIRGIENFWERAAQMEQLLKERDALLKRPEGQYSSDRKSKPINQKSRKMDEE